MAAALRGHIVLLFLSCASAEHKHLRSFFGADFVMPDQPAGVNLENAIANKPKLWLYWDSSETGERSEMQGSGEARRLSGETVYAQCGSDFEIHLVGRKSIHKHLDRFKLPKYFDKLPTNIQGDLGSVALLAEHGGVYLDLDVIMLRSLLPLWVEATSPDGPEFISMRNDAKNRPFIHGFMMARPKSLLLKKLFLECMAFLEKRGTCTDVECATYDNFGWADMIYGRGDDVVNAYVKQHEASYKAAGSDSMYTPQPWLDAAPDIFRTQPATYCYTPPEGAYLVHWMHKHCANHISDFDKMTEGELLDGKRVFSTLVLGALNRAVPPNAVKCSPP